MHTEPTKGCDTPGVDSSAFWGGGADPLFLCWTVLGWEHADSGRSPSVFPRAPFIGGVRGVWCLVVVFFSTIFEDANFIFYKHWWQGVIFYLWTIRLNECNEYECVGSERNPLFFFGFFRTCSFHHVILDMWLCVYKSTCLSILLQISQDPDAELFVCAASFLLEISCMIRFRLSRFAIWKAFCCFVQVANLEKRRGGHRLWVNYHRERSRPRTGVIFGACKCCNQGLGAPWKSWHEFSKKCKKKSHLLEKVGVASTKILGVHRLTPQFQIRSFAFVQLLFSLKFDAYLDFPPRDLRSGTLSASFFMSWWGRVTGKWFSILDGQYS